MVLGDTHARADRTTIATKFLRETKEKYKQTHKGEKRSRWIPLAMDEFRQQLPTLFPDEQVAEDDMGRVLVKCTPKAMDAKTARVLVPNLYAYPGDETATYGTAKWEESIEFFLNSRDAPTLASELEKHRKEFNKLRKSQNRPPRNMMTGFVKTLIFFQEKLEEAEKGDVLAEKLLESLKPINSLKEQWKMLENNKHPVEGESTEKVRWDGLELKIVERPSPRGQQQHDKQPVARVPTYRKPQAHRIHNHKRPRAVGKTSPVTSSLGNPFDDVPVETQAMRQTVASLGVGFQRSYARGGSPSLKSMPIDKTSDQQELFYPSPMPYAPRAPSPYAPDFEAPEHHLANHANTKTVPDQDQDFDDSLLPEDVLDFESDLLDHPDDFQMHSVLPADWEWNEVPPPTTSPVDSAFHTDHFTDNTAAGGDWLSISMGRDFSEELVFDSGRQSPMELSDEGEKQKAKGAFAPSWILVKIAAVASLLGLHTFKTPAEFSEDFSHKTRPTDLPDPASTPDAPCPLDEVCLHIMEAIYPVHPPSTLPLIGIPGTCQNWAREWLGSNKDVMEFDEQRIRQRYALAILYCETDGSSWNENGSWVSDLHECDWDNHVNVDPCGRQEQLQILRNEGRQMTGTLPPELSMISSLWDISFSDNLLTGTIPTDLAQLSELDTLLLDSNLFKGPLPDFMWEFEDMIHLDISYNFFTGTLPETLHLSEPSLQHLFLSYNMFSGTIPPTFGLIDWHRLHLDGNQFQGTIPEDINAGKLQELLLHNNQLSGTFPAESFSKEWAERRSKLEIVTLHENNLEGDVSIMCNLVNDSSIGSLETFVVDLDKVSCKCCSGTLS